MDYLMQETDEPLGLVERFRKEFPNDRLFVVPEVLFDLYYNKVKLKSCLLGKPKEISYAPEGSTDYLALIELSQSALDLEVPL
jgi:hypothetical protein